jgi:hypothetical protein
VEAEDGPHLFEQADILEAIDVDPGDGLAVRRRHQTLQGMDLPFFELGFIVFAEGDFRPVRMDLPDMNQGAGWETGLGGSSFGGSGHLPFPPGSNGTFEMGRTVAKATLM